MAKQEAKLTLDKEDERREWRLEDFIDPETEKDKTYWKWLESQLRHVQNKNQDLVILLTGYEGLGKSTLGLWLSLVVSYMQDRGFNLSQQVFYDGANMVKAAHELPHNSVLLYDEAARGQSSRESMTLINRHVMDHFATGRYLNHIYIVCHPNKNWLDKYMTNHRVKWWFLVRGAGRAVLHKGGSRDYSSKPRSWAQMFGMSYSKLDDEVRFWGAYSRIKNREARKVREHAAGHFVVEEAVVQDLARKLQVVLEEHPLRKWP